MSEPVYPKIGERPWWWPYSVDEVRAIRQRVDLNAESYIALQIASDGTRTERFVKDGVLISERELPDDEVWTGAPTTTTGEQR